MSRVTFTMSSRAKLMVVLLLSPAVNSLELKPTSRSHPMRILLPGSSSSAQITPINPHDDPDGQLSQPQRIESVSTISPTVTSHAGSVRPRGSLSAPTQGTFSLDRGSRIFSDERAVPLFVAEDLALQNAASSSMTRRNTDFPLTRQSVLDVALITGRIKNPQEKIRLQNYQNLNEILTFYELIFL